MSLRPGPAPLINTAVSSLFRPTRVWLIDSISRLVSVAPNDSPPPLNESVWFGPASPSSPPPASLHRQLTLELELPGFPGAQW